MTIPSEFDNINMPVSREFIEKHRTLFLDKYVKQGDKICDVGNQGKFIPAYKNHRIVTIDIDESTAPDIVTDITRYDHAISDETFDGVMCTEVLEHVVDPFAAVRQLHRVVKLSGFILITTPLNTRIHGPIPDCWRFTEFGLRVLFRDFKIVHFEKLNTPDRNLFPLHYATIVQRTAVTPTESDPRDLRFTPVD
jgi:hypothetical protein